MHYSAGDRRVTCRLHMQVTGIVSSFGLRWHPTLGMLNTILSIANFDTGEPPSSSLDECCTLPWSTLALAVRVGSAI